MPVAIIHDYLNQLGGAEKVLNVFLRLTSDATVYTSVVDSGVRAACVPPQVPVRCSFLQRLPLAVERTRLYLPLLPLAFERMSLQGHSLIVSISSAFAKGVRAPSGVPHLCYCQTPMRFAWNLDGYMRYERVSPMTRAAVRLLMAWFRRWDIHTSGRVTEFISISRTVQERVRRFYGRPSRIIYPPVDTVLYHPVSPQEKGDYYLVLSRLLPYKRIDVAIEACNRLRVPLIVAGEGRDEPRLRQMAGPTVHFTGRVPDDEARRCIDGIRRSVAAGMTVKVNAIAIPGVNDHHLPQVAVAMRELGVSALNLMAFRPVAGSGFADLTTPAATRLAVLRRELAAVLPVLSHCGQCRADAAGRIGQDNDQSVNDLLMEASTMSDHVTPRPHVAVASREGMFVNSHLGHASELLIYAMRDDAFELVDVRPAPPEGGGQERWQELAELLGDCRAVVASAAGASPERVLGVHGIRVLCTDGLIEDALEAVFAGREGSLLAPSCRSGTKCGGGAASGCGGGGMACA